MVTATIQEAQVHLSSLIAQLKPGEELVIIERNRPVARLVAEPSEEPGPRKPGIAIGKLKIIEDDDAHLEDFKEYMP
jgi:antitoxin (DNA-binding transcriptional repressor) of toxin-antitoxin stability system